MPKKSETVSGSAKPDLVEAATAIRHISRAIKKEYQLRRFPSASASYESVTSELSAARVHHRNGLTQLQAAVTAGTPDAEERIALQAAIQELLKSVKLLGGVL
jgi:hypothetical protein